MCRGIIKRPHQRCLVQSCYGQRTVFRHTVFVVLVHAVATPNALHVELPAHETHGALPVIDHVLPALHGTAHNVSVVFVHALFAPCVHVEFAAHAAHGAFPVEEKVLPASHATWHIVSFVMLHEFLTPVVQVESAVHNLQGSRPFPENEYPPTQGGIAPLHTTSVPGLQATLTPIGVHVDAAAHTEHGALPVADQVALALHATWHSVSAVLVQADFTPVAHVEEAAHVSQGAVPAVENVDPATHATWHTVSVVLMQAVFTPAAHVEAAAHGEQGVFPEEDQVEPAAQGGQVSEAQDV